MAFLSNSDLPLQGVNTVPSLGDPSFYNIFGEFPEYGYYSQSLGNDASALIDLDLATLLLSKSLDSPQTLLLPENMRSFYSLYDVKDYDSIKIRFRFSNDVQVDTMYAYLEEMIMKQLQQGGDYTPIALSGVLHKALSSYYSLEQSVESEMTYRGFSYQVSTQRTSCNDYIFLATADNARTTSICATSENDWTQVGDVREWVNGTLYSGDYRTNLEDKYGLSAAELDALYDTVDPNSFGSVIALIQADFAVKYSCKNAAKCDARDWKGLAAKQWGTLFIT